MHTTKQEAQLHNSRKPWSLCTTPINPVNSLSRQCAGNQHLLCKLALQNMMFRCSESVRVFCLHSGSSSCSRIPVTFQVVWNDTLSVATETSLPTSVSLFWAPHECWVCACRCMYVRGHIHKHNPAFTHICELQYDHLYHSFSLEAPLQLASGAVRSRQRSCGCSC